MNSHEHQTCLCAVCEMVRQGASHEEAYAAQRRWEMEQIGVHGWFIHFVNNDPDMPTGSNYHSHGVAENLGHPDLQIVLPMPSKVLMNIFHTIVGKIRTGERFIDGCNYPDIIANDYLVRIRDAEEGDRPVLRVILPDRDGNLEHPYMTHPFSLQHADLP